MNLELKNTLPIDAETGKRYLPTWDEYWEIISNTSPFSMAGIDFTKYYRFSTSPLSIGQFIPVGEEGDQLTSPKGYALFKDNPESLLEQYGDCVFNRCKMHQQAEDRVIFEGIHEREYRNESDTSGWLGIGTDELEVFTWGPFGYECNFKNLHSLAYEMGKFNQKLIVR